MFETVQRELELYDFISLEEMDTVKLMNRMDTKYLMRVGEAVALIRSLKDGYRALSVAGQLSGAYRSVYYDTPDLQMLYTHITGRYPRFKVRERNYSQNGLNFFEIKQKSNHGRTVKKRLPVDGVNRESAEMLLRQQTPFDMDGLQRMFINRFDRITLVNRAKTERLTLDFNLQFSPFPDRQTLSFPGIAVVEVKQDKRSKSAVTGLLRQAGVRQAGMSKYCIGMLLLNGQMSCKRYKPNLSVFLKLNNS